MASWAPTFTTLCASMVTPKMPTPPHHLFLAGADVFWRWFHYNQRILFFKLHQPSTDPSFFIAHLKSSLALALVDFFPLAGRLLEQADGRLTLDCDDAGVGFIESSIDLPFSSLEADGFQYKPFFKLFAPHGDVVQWTPELPLLSVQRRRCVAASPGEWAFIPLLRNAHSRLHGASIAEAHDID